MLTGLGGFYYYGFTYGGPVVVVWGWVIIVTMTLTVALPMAEICSSLPTTGGVYYCESWGVGGAVGLSVGGAEAVGGAARRMVHGLRGRWTGQRGGALLLQSGEAPARMAASWPACLPA